MVVDDYGKVSLEDLNEKEYEKAIYKYELLTGKKVLTNVLLKQWLKQWNVNQKSREQVVDM